MLKQMKHISIIVLKGLREGFNTIFKYKKQRISETNKFLCVRIVCYIHTSYNHNLQPKEIFLIFSA